MHFSRDSFQPFWWLRERARTGSLLDAEINEGTFRAQLHWNPGPPVLFADKLMSKDCWAVEQCWRHIIHAIIQVFKTNLKRITKNIDRHVFSGAWREFLMTHDSQLRSGHHSIVPKYQEVMAIDESSLAHDLESHKHYRIISLWWSNSKIVACWLVFRLIRAAGIAASGNSSHTWQFFFTFRILQLPTAHTRALHSVSGSHANLRTQSQLNRDSTAIRISARLKKASSRGKGAWKAFTEPGISDLRHVSEIPMRSADSSKQILPISSI